MDFTGTYGKIVEDPLEAEAIAVAEGRYWNKVYVESHFHSTLDISTTEILGLC